MDFATPGISFETGGWHDMFTLPRASILQEALPAAIGGWNKLRRLDLANNKLKEIPHEVSNATLAESKNIKKVLFIYVDSANNTPMKSTRRPCGRYLTRMFRLRVCFTSMNVSSLSLCAQADSLAELEHVDISGNPVRRMPLAIERLQTKVWYRYYFCETRF